MGEKTEKATPKKLRDAKKKGQVAKSQDFPAAATFIVSISVTMAMVSGIYQEIGKMMTDCFSLATHPNISQILGSLYAQAVYVIFRTTIPIALSVTAIGIFVTFLTVGPVFATDVFKFDIKKFNPVDNLKGKFKMKTFVDLILSVLKISIAGALVYNVVMNSIPVLIQAQSLPLIGALKIFSYFLWQVVIQVGLFFGAVAIFDFSYQKYNFGKEMMMEKFEIKQEYKDSEGNPEIKGKRKEIAREIAFSDGPAAGAARANAVVTNPTHLAIALGYEKELDPCPYILAMGKAHVAEQIIKMAEQNNVPVIRNIPLAHILWEEGKLYEYVPENTYELVAEILRWLAELEYEEKVNNLKF
ncbi:MAG: type III secretion system export apparatus subunit SctU [Chlamydia sp.]